MVSEIFEWMVFGCSYLKKFPTRWESPNMLGVLLWENINWIFREKFIWFFLTEFIPGCRLHDNEQLYGNLYLLQKKNKMKILFSIILSMAGLVSFSQDITQLRRKQFNLDDGIAINGYDPVAYFKQSKAVKGKKSLAVYNQGATYYFSSEENKEEFKINPSGYEPQYGGWCAYAMGKDGSKVEIDPETFKIIDGRLYLYYNRFFNNTLKSWNKDETNLKAKADANWQKFFH